MEACVGLMKNTWDDRCLAFGFRGGAGGGEVSGGGDAREASSGTIHNQPRRDGRFGPEVPLRRQSKASLAFLSPPNGHASG